MVFRLVLTCSLAVASLFASPDEVKLKSGKEYKNLKLDKESKTEYVFVDHDGKKITIAKSSIETYVPKETLREDFDRRRAAITTPDAKALVALAKWALEQDSLLDKEAKTLYEEVVKIDPENAAARAALGFVKKDGGWSSPEAAASAEAAAYEARAKLAGGKQIKGAWLLPADVSKRELKLVEHDGHWVTAERKKQIEEKNLVFSEGMWLDAEERERFLKHERKDSKGQWKSAAEMDSLHDRVQSPWNLVGRWVDVATTAKHERGRMVLKTADEVAAAAVKWSGVEPNVYGKEKRLLIGLAGKPEDFQRVGQSAGSDWATERYNLDSVFHLVAPPPGLGIPRGRGISITVDVDPDNDGDFIRYWVRRGTIEAFVARFTNIEKTDVNVLDAFATYFAGFKGDKYAPNWWTYVRFLSKDKPFKNVGDILKRARPDRDCKDPSLAQAGFFVHYMASKNLAATKEGFLKFLGGKLTSEQLATSVFGDLKGEALQKDFDAFVTAFRASFKPSDK